MKKVIFALTLVVALASCGGNSTEVATTADSTKTATATCDTTCAAKADSAKVDTVKAN